MNKIVFNFKERIVGRVSRLFRFRGRCGFVIRVFFRRGFFLLGGMVFFDIGSEFLVELVGFFFIV